MMVDGSQVRACLLILLGGQLSFVSAAGVNGHLRIILIGLNRPFCFKSAMCSLGGLLPGFQKPSSFQVDRTFSRDGSCGGQQGSRSPSFGLACSSNSRLYSPFRGGASTVLSACGYASGRWPSPLNDVSVRRLIHELPFS